MRPTDFRDDASRAEAAITVLCQACQDEIFGAMTPPADLPAADSDESGLKLEPEWESEMERPVVDPANDRTCKKCGTHYNFTHEEDGQYWDGAWDYATGCDTHCLTCWLVG